MCPGVECLHGRGGAGRPSDLWPGRAGCRGGLRSIQPPLLGAGAQEPRQGSDTVPDVWRVTGAGTAPGMKVSLADLCTVMTVSSICKAPTMCLPFSQSLHVGFAFQQRMQ